MEAINFDYAFAPPHTLTLCRPSASEKIVTDTYKSGIKFSWSYTSQRGDYPLAWTQHPIDVCLYLDVSINRSTTPFTKWYRHESGAPFLCAEGNEGNTSFLIHAVATKTGVVIKTALENFGNTASDIHIQLAHTSGWVISNKGWIDGIHNNLLMTMNDGRADRILALAYGADDYPMYPCNLEEFDGLPPMNNLELGVAPHSMKKITAYYHLEKGQCKTGYFLIPYKKYFHELDTLKAISPQKEMDAALREWKKLLSRSTRFDISDSQLLHCYYSCLADLFVMREKIGKYTGITCGTRIYRSANSGEPLESEILLDTIGYTKEAVQDYRMYFEAQESDGCWATTKGWEHEGWGILFNKANAVLEHYYLTRDLAFLEENYKRMYDSTVYNYNARQSTKHAPRAFERGLMPRGMGDCGMMNGGDYYGVFYPPNCISVAADFKTLEAARILEKAEDLPFLEQATQEAKADLLISINNNLLSYEDYVMMPAIANAPVSSMFGCMFPYFPAKLVAENDPMITGAVKYIEGKRISEGGLPQGTGWQKDGIWVAMALGSIARTYLRLGMYQQARKYLYPALNHASPYVTYCEERGSEKGSDDKTGDNQHLWTPLSVCQYMTDAFWFEEDEIHICAGILPEWLLEGKRVGLSGLKTHYGNTDLSLTYEDGKFTFRLQTERPMERNMILHLPKNHADIESVSIASIGKTQILHEE